MHSRTRRMVRWPLWLAAALLFAVACGRSKVETAKPIPPRDHAVEFEQLAAATGLPDLSDAQYVKTMGGPQLEGHLRELVRGGWVDRGWLVPAPADRPATDPVTHVFVAWGHTNIAVVPPQEDTKVDESQEMEYLTGETRSTETVAVVAGEAVLACPLRWRKADLNADAARLREAAEKHYSASARGPARSGKPDKLAAPLLVMAAQYHRAGATDEANRIAEIVLASGQTPKQITNAAVNVLGDAACNAAFRHVEHFADWGAYSKALGRVVEVYGTSWRHRDMAERVAAEAAVIGTDSAADVTPAKATEETRAILEAQPTTPGKVAEQQLREACQDVWLLSPPYLRDRLPGPGAGPVVDIVCRRLASLPLLAEMVAGDTSLVACDREAIKDMFSKVTPHLTRGDTLAFADGADHADGLASSSERRSSTGSPSFPLRRWELGLLLAAPLLTSLGDDLPTDLEELRDAMSQKILALHDAYRDRRPSDLARHYLAQGTGNQKRAAFAYLKLHAETVEDHRAVVARMDQLDVRQAIYSFVDYARRHRGAALPAYQRLVARFEADTARDALCQGQEYRELEEGHAFVVDIGLSEAIDAVANSVGVDRNLERRLLLALGKAPFVEGIGELLRGLAASETEGPRHVLMRALTAFHSGSSRWHITDADGPPLVPRDWSPWPTAAGPYDEDEPYQPTEAEKYLPVQHAKLWRRLLDDPRPYGLTPTEGDMATTVSMLLLALPGIGHLTSRGRPGGPWVMNYFPNESLPLIRPLALALLDGRPLKDLPPLPNLGARSPRLRDLVTGMEQARDADALARIARRLTMDERFSLFRSGRAAGEAGYRTLAIRAYSGLTRIHTVDLPDDIPAILATTAADLEGRMLDERAVIHLATVCVNLARRGEMVSWAAVRGVWEPGFSLRVKRVPGPIVPLTEPGMGAQTSKAAVRLWRRNWEEDPAMSVSGALTMTLGPEAIAVLTVKNAKIGGAPASGPDQGTEPADRFARTDLSEEQVAPYFRKAIDRLLNYQTGQWTSLGKVVIGMDCIWARKVDLLELTSDPRSGNLDPRWSNNTVHDIP